MVKAPEGFEITRPMLETGLEKHHRGDSLPSIRDFWSEYNYNPQKETRQMQFFCTVSPEDAKRLESTEVGLMSHVNGRNIGFGVGFSTPQFPRDIREQWRKTGLHFETLKSATSQLESMGAVLPNGCAVYVLPSRFRDRSEYPQLAEKLKQPIKDMNFPEGISSMLRIRFVDLKDMQGRVDTLNRFRLEAVLGLRGIQATTDLDFNIPGFDC